MSDSIAHLAWDLDKLSLVKDVFVKSVHNDELVINKIAVPKSEYLLWTRSPSKINTSIHLSSHTVTPVTKL